MCSETSSLNSDTNVEVGELVLSQDEDGFEGLQTEAFWLNVLNGLTIDFDETTALLGESTGGCRLFPKGERWVW